MNSFFSVDNWTHNDSLFIVVLILYILQGKKLGISRQGRFILPIFSLLTKNVGIKVRCISLFKKRKNPQWQHYIQQSLKKNENKSSETGKRKSVSLQREKFVLNCFVIFASYLSILDEKDSEKFSTQARNISRKKKANRKQFWYFVIGFDFEEVSRAEWFSTRHRTQITVKLLLDAPTRWTHLDFGMEYLGKQNAT